MRYVAALTLLLVASSARANDVLIGKDLVTGPHGQPICTEKDQLQEYFMAVIKQDQQWIKQLSSCGMLKASLKVAVIEEYPSDSDIGHVVKIRAFGARGSAVGYTLSLGLTPK